MTTQIKPKILFIVPLPPPIHGAALRNQSLVQSQMLNKYFNIRVLPMHFIASMKDMGKFSLNKLFKSIAFQFSIIGALLSFRPQLVYFNVATYGFALYRDYLYSITVRLLGFPMAMHVRTQRVKEQTTGSSFKRNLFKSFFRRSTVICLSKILAEDLDGVLSKDPVIINNGIALMNFSFQRNPSDKVRILFLSNFMKSKGIVELIEASRICKEKGYDFSLTIAGSDFDFSKSEIEEMVRKQKLESVIHVKGGIYGEAKIRELTNADIFVLPSYFEAFPGVILEAMQAGIPVISTFEGAIPEIVENNQSGVLVRPKDTRELALAMQDLLSNPQKRKMMGLRGKELFHEKFTLEIFEKNMADLFTHLCASQPES